MPSIHCLHDLGTFPGFFFSTEVLGHQQIVGYEIPPFWLIFKHIYSQSLSFPNSSSTVYKHIKRVSLNSTEMINGLCLLS